MIEQLHDAHRSHEDLLLNREISRQSLFHPPSPAMTSPSPAVNILHTKFRHGQRQSSRNCASKTTCPIDYHDELFVESARRSVQHLHGAWLDQALCDVVLITADGYLSAHKAILTAGSPSLHTLYIHQQQLLMDTGHEPHTSSGLEAQLDLSDFSMEPVADVVNFIYTGDIDLDSKNIGQVTACCRELGIELLVNICRKYLIDACDPHNVVLHYSIAANNAFDDLSARLLRVICEAFPEVSRNRHILYLPVSRIVAILTHSALCAEEMQVFLMITRWLDFQRHDRLQYACRLLKLVRFQLIQPEVLANEVQRIRWLFANPSCMEPVFEAYKYHALNLVGSKAVKDMTIQDGRCSNERHHVTSLKQHTQETRRHS